MTSVRERLEAEPQIIAHHNIVPELKTHKATAKRFKITDKGKLRQMKQRRSHLHRKKSKRVRRLLRLGKPK